MTRTQHGIAIGAGALLALLAWWLDNVLLALFAGPYLAFAVRDAGVAWLASLQPSTKAERRLAASVESAVRRRIQANTTGAAGT